MRGDRTFFKRLRQIQANFKKLSKKDQTQILGVLCVALAIVIVVIAILVNLGLGRNTNRISELPFSGSVNSAADQEYDPNGLGLDPELFKDTILQETEDAGEEYLLDTLFIGDSNTAGIYVCKLLTLQNVIGIPSMGIQSATYTPCVYFYGYSEPVTIPAAVAMLKPRRVIINFGANNADGSVSPEAFVAQYLRLINAIEEAYPYCDIIVQSIPPLGRQRDYPNLTMQTIDGFNVALAEMCREEGYKFLNCSEILKGTNGFIKPEYISADGLHLNADGYAAILEYARTHTHITRDRRPNTSNIPQRRPAPYIPPSSSEEEISSSSSGSSSYEISSSIEISSYVEVSTTPSTLPGEPSSELAPETPSDAVTTGVEDEDGTSSYSNSGSGSSSISG
jgi:Lysophospholipase L1 and related esterases